MTMQKRPGGGGAGQVPANVDAERWILGAILKDPSLLTTLGEAMSSEEFFLEAHRHIYAAIDELFGAGKPIDLVAVAEVLQRAGMLEAVGGPLALRDLMLEVGTTDRL